MFRVNRFLFTNRRNMFASKDLKKSLHAPCYVSISTNKMKSVAKENRCVPSF